MASLSELKSRSIIKGLMNINDIDVLKDYSSKIESVSTRSYEVYPNDIFERISASDMRFLKDGLCFHVNLHLNNGGVISIVQDLSSSRFVTLRFNELIGSYFTLLYITPEGRMDHDSELRGNDISEQLSYMFNYINNL